MFQTPFRWYLNNIPCIQQGLRNNPGQHPFIWQETTINCFLPMDKTITRNEYMRIIEEEKELLGSASCDANVQSNPSNNTINNILNFSKAYSCRNSESVGNIENVLN